ncbi:MAG: hypothetical protein IKE45_04785 [Halomonas sp.]|nr:hypothetical protein [Halomonas sp.]MBR2513332.1 hypothetical protein [Halomonas sp.]
MSSQDQAAGLRKWADLQRQQRGEMPEDTLPDEPVPAEPVSKEAASVYAASAMVPTVEAPPTPKQPLVVVGLSTHQHQVNKVRSRLSQWSALGRRWAGDPDGWDIHLVDPATANLPLLVARYPRWALWVSSDADAFMPMYRVLRQVHDNKGPKRLLALHEPHLPRQGLLDNLREAAAGYLDTELLLLAR